MSDLRAALRYGAVCCPDQTEQLAQVRQATHDGVLADLAAHGVAALGPVEWVEVPLPEGIRRLQLGGIADPELDAFLAANPEALLVIAMARYQALNPN